MCPYYLCANCGETVNTLYMNKPTYQKMVNVYILPLTWSRHISNPTQGQLCFTVSYLYSKGWSVLCWLVLSVCRYKIRGGFALEPTTNHNIAGLIPSLSDLCFCIFYVSLFSSFCTTFRRRHKKAPKHRSVDLKTKIKMNYKQALLSVSYLIYKRSFNSFKVTWVKNAYILIALFFCFFFFFGVWTDCIIS